MKTVKDSSGSLWLGRPSLTGGVAVGPLSGWVLPVGPQGCLLTLALSADALGQVTSMSEATEVGVPPRLVKSGTHTNRSHPGVDEQCPKRKYWRLFVKTADFQKVLLF